MAENEDIEEHESYGLIGFSRVSSSHGQNFFGSSVKSSHYIELTIRRGHRTRNLNQYWYGPDEEIVEVRLSPNQFAELLTTMNMGSGVPCTIQYVGRTKMEECPSIDQREKFEREFKSDIKTANAKAKEIAADVAALFDTKGTIKQSDRAAILEKLRMLMQQIESNMPFVQTQFNEAMDKTVAEAKGEVEAFVNHKIHSLGINALNTEILAALEAPLDSEPLRLRDGSPSVEPPELIERG